VLASAATDDLQPLVVAQPHDTKRVPDLKLDFGTSAPPQPPEPPPSRTSEAAAAAAAATDQPPGFWDVINPVAEKRFFEEYWTRRPLHIVRGRASAVEQQRDQRTKKRVVATEPAPQPYSDLVGSCAIDQLLRGSPTLQVCCSALCLYSRRWSLPKSSLRVCRAFLDVHARGRHGHRAPRSSAHSDAAGRLDPSTARSRARPFCQRPRGLSQWPHCRHRISRDVVWQHQSVLSSDDRVLRLRLYYVALLDSAE
jgi:hypothetical protein